MELEIKHSLCPVPLTSLLLAVASTFLRWGKALLKLRWPGWGEGGGGLCSAECRLHIMLTSEASESQKGKWQFDRSFSFSTLQ